MASRLLTVWQERSVSNRTIRIKGDYMPWWVWLDKDILIALIAGVAGSGVAATLLRAWVERRQTKATSEQLAVQAAHEATEILRQDIIQPLREQVEAQEKQLDKQERQIRALQAAQRQYKVAIKYIRKLCHWLDPAVAVMEPDYMRAHPKPRLPDELREHIASESINQGGAGVSHG
jgi:hypothetical protein